jgi:hypothetical protein
MPLGWHISVYRQTGDRSAPATANAERGARIAVWQTRLWGLQWIDDLVKSGRGHSLGGNGYPSRYTALTRDLLPTIMAGSGALSNGAGQRHVIGPFCANSSW